MQACARLLCVTWLLGAGLACAQGAGQQPSSLFSDQEGRRAVLELWRRISGLGAVVSEFKEVQQIATQISKEIDDWKKQPEASASSADAAKQQSIKNKIDDLAKRFNALATDAAPKKLTANNTTPSDNLSAGDPEARREIVAQRGRVEHWEREWKMPVKSWEPMGGGSLFGNLFKSQLFEDDELRRAILQSMRQLQTLTEGERVDPARLKLLVEQLPINLRGAGHLLQVSVEPTKSALLAQGAQAQLRIIGSGFIPDPNGYRTDDPPPAQRPSPVAGQTIKDCPDCPEMVVLPAGSFEMGTPPDPRPDPFSNAAPKTIGAADEKPQRRVQIAPFAIGKYEVTQEQWYAVMGANPSRNKGRTLPVEQVSWEDVQVFIQKLNQKTGQQYRLPSEAEWEYAARAGSQTEYSFGDDEKELGRYAWYRANSGGQTHPVGEK